MLEQVFVGLISALCGIIGTYVILRKLFNPADFLYNILNSAMEDTEIQKRLYMLGAIIGNGIKAGVGLNPRQGKFKFEDLIAMALSQFFMPKTEKEATTEIPAEIFERRRA